MAQMIKNLSAMQETGFQDLDWEYHLEKGIATHSRIQAGEPHGQRSLAGYSTWGHKELDTTEATEHDIHKQQSIRKRYQNRDHKNIP